MSEGTGCKDSVYIQDNYQFVEKIILPFRTNAELEPLLLYGVPQEGGVLVVVDPL
jgi:hypothetical protein